MLSSIWVFLERLMETHSSRLISEKWLFDPTHPEYNWMAPALEDMKAGPWTEFKSGEKQ